MLGRAVLEHLINAQERVTCIVRASDKQSATLRLRNVLRGIHTLPRNVDVLCADIAHDFSPTADQFWAQNVTYILLHVAASTSFTDERLCEEVNVNGTRNVLEFASRLGVAHVCYVSSAYAGGTMHYMREVSLQETPFAERSFANPYERSKAVAERMVEDWCAEYQVRYSIHRPSIIVGSFVTGESTDVHRGLYGWAYLTYKYLHHAECQLSRLARAMCWHVSATTHLNLVPVEWVAQIVCSAVRLQCVGYYNLVHPKPPLVRTVVRTILHTQQFKPVRFREVSGQAIMSVEPDQHRTVRALVRALSRNLSPFNPYVQGVDRRFEREQAVSLCEHLQVSSAPRPCGEAVLRRMLGYGMHVWQAQEEQVLARVS